MNSTIQIRIDAKTKELARKKFKSAGLDLSSGIKFYLAGVASSDKFVGVNLTENGYTKEFEERMVKETNLALKNGKSFKNTKELMKYILKD